MSVVSNAAVAAPSGAGSMRARYHRVRTRVLEIRRSLKELGLGRRAAFQAERRTAAYQHAYELERPLVSCIIATFNRGPLLVERSLKSLLAQTYDNLDIIVVGDACTDDTEARMREVTDPRVRFVNLPERGAYPTDPYHRWMVAGSAAMNHGLDLAKGDFVTHLDDDDEHPPHRVATLLDVMRQQRADLVWHPFDWESAPDVWHRNEAAEFKFKSATTSSIFYHAWFKRIHWDLQAWKHLEPGDWNRLRKIRFLGARTHRHGESLLRHFKERNQRTA